jgi:tripeptidyl-peptidase I
MVAGIVALLNDARIKAGLPTLGFLNPLLYSISEHHPEGFNDITTGHNIGCGTQGFPVRSYSPRCSVYGSY